MAIDAYLQIDGITGESTDPDHKGWIDVLSYSYSISQLTAAPVANVSAGATSAVAHQEFVITKYVDSASPKVYEACAAGKRFSKAILDVMRTSGKTPVKFMQIQMQQVIISSISASAASGKDMPTESVALSYGSVQWTYTQQNPDGSQGGSVTGAGSS